MTDPTHYSGVKMLVSPPILAATREPILTAFSVSNKLYILAKRREEYRDIYSSLAQEVFMCVSFFGRELFVTLV